MENEIEVFEIEGGKREDEKPAKEMKRSER